MADLRKKFTTRVDPEVLAAVRQLAQAEGRPLQALVEEALKDLIEKRKNSSLSPGVMAAYQASHARYATLYQKLAK